MKLKQLERSFWIFVVGILSGSLCYAYISLKNDKNYGSSSQVGQTITVSPKMAPYYQFIDQSLNYLSEYYIDQKSLKYKELFLGAVEGMYKAVGDPYTSFLNPSYFSNISDDIGGDIGGIGIYIQSQNRTFKVISLVPKSPAAESEIQLHDQILKINGTDISRKDIDSVIDMLQGKIGTKVNLTVLSSKTLKPFNTTLKRQSIHIQSAKGSIIAPHNIGYLKIEKFTDSTAREAKVNLLNFLKSKIKGLIIDVRDNPGGSLQASIDVANFFIKKGLILETKGTNPEDNEQFFADPKKMIFPSSTKIVVLVNEESASAAEIIAGTLKDHKRAKIVGVQTFGKGAVQSIFPFHFNNDEIGYKITVANYYTPGGYIIANNGITPDYVVSLPEVSPSLEIQIDSIIKQEIINKILKDKLKNPISQSDYNLLKKELEKRDYHIPDLYLKKVIYEQRNLLNGTLASVNINYDTQLRKAIQILLKG